jgi:AraC-like DNA-binding protein
VTPSSSIVRSSILPDFKRLALALDLDVPSLMRRVGIDSRHFEDPDLPLPLRSLIELLEIAALASGLDDFGLRLGEARGLPDIGPLILMLREEATVRDSLRTLTGSFHLYTHALCMTLEDDGDDPIFRIDVVAGDVGACRHAMESGVAGMTHIMRWLLGEDWAPATVCFTHSRPSSRARYHKFFRCPVDFLGEFNGLALRREDLDRRLPASSPVLRRQVERYIRTINVASSDTYVHRVAQIVAMALPRNEARADIVAGYLGTNRRTLNRRLGRSAANYSAILETVRKSQATQYLANRERTLAEIAGLTGFNSLSAFTRWFRQAFGCTPSAWRRAHAPR